MDAFQYLFSLEKFGIKFGLANIRALCRALGDPERAFRSILIAGTNGKGSVTAMVERGLRAAGARTGRYTSPHLVRLEERFAVNGESVATPVLRNAVERVRETINALLLDGTLGAPPTFFEATTAAAFEIFRQAQIEVAVLEVGLGGRLDSTNCVEPVAAAITSIAFDHQQYLGNTLGAIAAEKAGVMRPDIPVVLGPLDAEARAAIVERGHAIGSHLIDAFEGVCYRATVADGVTTLDLQTSQRDLGKIPLALRGSHQVSNAIVAARLLEELRGLFPITNEAIVSGLRDVDWPGRLELISGPNGKQLLLDAAHNPAGAAALAAYLTSTYGPLPVVFGAMRDKDVPGMLTALLPACSRVVMTEPPLSRAMSAQELADLARQISPGVPVTVETDPVAALDLAWERSQIACAAGSIFLIGALLERLPREVRNF